MPCPERTNDRATKSASSSQATARSAMTGWPAWAAAPHAGHEDALARRDHAGRSQRADLPGAGPRPAPRTARVPSPITISERPAVTASARSGQPAGIAPSGALQGTAKTISSPPGDGVFSRSVPRRGLGPARSTRSAKGAPGRSAASRSASARARHLSASSWAQLIRPPSIPAATSSSMRPAGPRRARAWR